MRARQNASPDPVGRPTAIWWLDDGDSTTPRDGNAGIEASVPAVAAATASTAGFLARLSKRLVLTYTSAGDVVVDLNQERHLSRSAAQTGRQYLSIANSADVAALDLRRAPTSLIVARWPATLSGQPLSSITDLFWACRLILTADVATLALVAAPNSDHISTEVPADALQGVATSIGLHPAGRILAVHQPGGGDRFQYYADAREVADALGSHRFGSHPVVWIDLFATTTGDRRRA